MSRERPGLSDRSAADLGAHSVTARRSEPGFIVAVPRSGSTLLRLVLDAHPEIGCPGETGLPALASQLLGVWTGICSDVAGATVTDLPTIALRSARRALRAPMDHYCEQTGKHIYCDKSLDAPDNLPALGRAFPRARYILLYRHVFDVVASGLEGSPFGFESFGYARFVQNSVENFVAPLVQLWIARVRRALEWQAENAARCHTVRYEDMVIDPESTFSEIFQFLGVGPDPSAIDRALLAAPDMATPGDQKIVFTTAVHAASIGRGRRIPVGLVPPMLLAEANELLALLGYPRVTATWNTEQSLPHEISPRVAGDASRLRELMPTRVAAASLARDAGDCAIVVDDVDAMAWVVNSNGHVSSVESPVAEITLHGGAAAWVTLLEREDNAATMFRHGRLRFGVGATSEQQRTVTLLIKALQAAVTR